MDFKSALIGRWSSYDYDGYGTMEDESLVFLPDYTGWYAYNRGWLCERETFHWSLDSNNLLSMTCRQYGLIGNQPGEYEERPSDNPTIRVSFHIREEQIQWPDEAQKLVLTFAESPFTGNIKFALRTADSTKIVFPRFKGEPGYIEPTIGKRKRFIVRRTDES